MPSPIKSDITIIGAGPAGLTTALMLGKKEISCLLIDKDQFPRQKICGDGLSGKVVSILEKIDPGYVAELGQSDFATESKAVRFFSPSLKMMELSFQPEKETTATGFVCKRIDFDQFLLNQALKFPSINFQYGIRVENLVRNNDSVILEDKEGRQIAVTRLVLFAAGANRKLIRQLDPTYITPSVGIGVRGYFENVTGSNQNNAIEIHFLKELLPWYFWIFPFHDGSANAGLALPSQKAKDNQLNFRELFYHLIEKYPHLKKRFEKASLNGKMEAARLPYYSGPMQIAGDNYLLLGDAASLIDPFTGEGIGNAMLSGYYAAETAVDCLESKDFTPLITKNYQQKIDKNPGAELKLGLKLQNLARRQFILNLVIGRASRDENTRKSISEMLYSNEQKGKLSKTSFYIKLILGL
jgi:menaquinone-9 beta-reductase